MSHTAILARAHGVPMIVQTGAIPDAKTALLDADRGLLKLDPSDAESQTFEARNAKRATPEEGAKVSELATPASFHGEPVRLLLNIEGAEKSSASLRPLRGRRRPDAD